MQDCWNINWGGKTSCTLFLFICLFIFSIRAIKMVSFEWHQRVASSYHITVLYSWTELKCYWSDFFLWIRRHYIHVYVNQNSQAFEVLEEFIASSSQTPPILSVGMHWVWIYIGLVNLGRAQTVIALYWFGIPVALCITCIVCVYCNAVYDL